MKYIDADKLIAEIEKRAKFHDDAMKACAGLNNIAITHSAGWKEDTEILAIITSIQQEQPELPGYDKALLDVKSKVDELYEEASIGLNEYDSGLYNGIAETCMKLRGFIKARLDSDERHESELEKVARMNRGWEA